MKNLFLTLLILCITFPALAAEKETAYDRVMKTGAIRCGYGTWKPWIWQDMTSKKFMGVVVDVMEEVAKQLNLKLEWPEETGWGEIPTALNNGRVDVACSMLWNDPLRGRQVAFTSPVFYTAVYAYTRKGDARFTSMKKLSDLNSPDVRIAAQEGDFSFGLSHRLFPKAQLVTIAPNAQFSDVYLNVATGKADLVLMDAVAAQTYNAANDRKLERIPLKDPVTVYGTSFAVGIHETALKEMLETTVRYLEQTGMIDELTAKFRQEYPDAVILPKKAY